MGTGILSSKSKQLVILRAYASGGDCKSCKVSHCIIAHGSSFNIGLFLHDLTCLANKTWDVIATWNQLATWELGFPSTSSRNGSPHYTIKWIKWRSEHRNIMFINGRCTHLFWKSTHLMYGDFGQLPCPNRPATSPSDLLAPRHSQQRSTEQFGHAMAKSIEKVMNLPHIIYFWVNQKFYTNPK